MECLCLDLPLLFEAINDILVAPPNLMRQTLHNQPVVNTPPCPIPYSLVP